MSTPIVQESYLEAYCKFLYYNCLIPFKPVWKSNGNSLVLEGNGFQKILCIIFQSLVLLNIFLELPLLTQESIKDSPLVLFKYSMSFFAFSVFLTWNISFWRKTDQFTQLVYETTTYRLFPDTTFYKFKKRVLYISPTVVALLGYVSGIKICNGVVRLPGNIYTTPIFTNESNWQNLLLLVTQIPLCCSTYMGACFDILTVIIGISVYDFTKAGYKNTSINSTLQNISGDVKNQPNIKKMVKNAKQIQAYFNNLNDFYSNLFLFWFCIEFPWIPLQMVQISTVKDYGVIEVIGVVNTCICSGFYVVTGILYSESRKKAMQFKTDAIEYLLEDPFNIDSKQNLVKYFEITLEDAVIKGGNYVRISYEFLGSVVSALIGYGFLVLQFRSASSATLGTQASEKGVNYLWDATYNV